LETIQKLWQQGLSLHQSGDLSAAKAIYQEILSLDRDHFDSLYLSSAIATQENDLPLAKILLNKALSVNPRHIDANFNLAVLMEKSGDMNNALEKYSLLINLQHDHLEAIFNRSSIYAKLGKLEEAAQGFQCVLKIRPNLVAAQEHYERLITAIQEQKRETFLNHNLDDFSKTHEKGLQLFASNQIAEAIQEFEKATTLAPASPEAFHNLGMSLEKIGRLEDSLKSYERTLELNPNLAPTHNNIGNVLRELGRPEKSLAYFKNAISLNPNYAEAYSNYGWTLYGLRKFNESLECYQKALTLNPELVAARFNLSLCQLIMGDLKNGWVNYEYRFEQPTYIKRQFSANTPQWQGQPLQDKSILIHAEQGLGDTIQFCRFITNLAALGARVYFEIQSPLSETLKDLDGVFEFVTNGQTPPSVDYHCPLMSLPLALSTTLESIPNQAPYIFANKGKENFWKERLASIQKPKVGLVWNGGFRPNQPELWGVNQRRNIPLALIKNLQHIGVHFISLQKGEMAEQELLEFQEGYWPHGNFSNFNNELNDFSDTAALISNLDLVISVDTSTAHLAGALGKPVWILSRYDGCWRWLSSGSDSPWYPTAKLYRQEQVGDWETVITTARNDLQLKFSANKHEISSRY
jgi:tetratricopeptide (TPR) repeat protein